MPATLPRHSDTVDKVVQTYFACVTRVPFTYKGQQYTPKPLRVSSMIFRGYTCPPQCGGCCKKFTLDYIPSEQLPDAMARTSREIDFNGRPVLIESDFQNENTADFCKHLRRDDGRCGIHGVHPFSCDFELIRFLTSESQGRNQLTQKLFGRGWSYARVDGGKGALCSMTDITKESVADVARKIRRLKEWADHFGLDTVLPALISWVETGPHPDPLFLNQEFDHGNASVSLPILS